MKPPPLIGLLCVIIYHQRQCFADEELSVPGFTWIGTSCYMVDATCGTQEEAAQRCALRNATLASFEKLQERDRVFAWLYSTYDDGISLWLSGRNVEGTWQWENGEPIVGEMWYPSQPSGENAVLIWSLHGTLSVQDISYWYRYAGAVCEIDCFLPPFHFWEYGRLSNPGSAINDDDVDTCMTLTASDLIRQNIALISNTPPFKRLTIHLFVNDPGPNSVCDVGSAVLTQAAPRRLGYGACRPFCGTPFMCLKTETIIHSITPDEHIFECSCPKALCNDVAIHLPQIDVSQSYPLELCMVHAEVLE